MKQLTLVFFLFFSFQAVAQRTIFNRVIDKAIDETGKKVENRINNKIDTVIDNNLDKLDRPVKKSNNNESNVTKNRPIKREKSQFQIEPFPKMSMSMLIEYPTKANENCLFNYYLKDYECAFEMKPIKKKAELDRMIMNFYEKKSTMLMTDNKGKKTGMVIDLGMFEGIADRFPNQSNHESENEDLPKRNFNLTATSEYKTIEGYKCRKYVHEDEDYTQDIWVTNDIKTDFSKMRMAMASSFANAKIKSNQNYLNSLPSGMMIQNHIKPKSKKEIESIMTFKNIQMGSAPIEKFSTAGYEITEMPSLQNLLKNRD